MTAVRSHELVGRAQRVLVGGVNSPVRSFAAVGGNPPVIAGAEGASLIDEDGRRYVDFVRAWGPHILEHPHPRVVDAVRRQVERGYAYGATSALEIDLAERIRAAMPSLEMVRCVNSGTEATMSAIRLARGITGRDRIVKFAGGYHGHADCLLASAGSGVATLGIPGSPGVPAGTVQDTIVLPYNDPHAVDAVFAIEGETIAAIIVEPVAGNMGCVPPKPNYLERLRATTRDHGALLIFDEVITGFRVAYGGAQELYGVTPDLTCLAKVVGGGLPFGAYGGPTALMEHLAPVGDVYQAGTLAGNPLAMAAGCAILDELSERRQDVYPRLENLGARLEVGLTDAAASSETPLTVNRVGGILTAFFTGSPVTDYESAKRSDTAAFGQAHRRWLEAGIWWPPGQFEAAMLCTAHTEDDIDRAIDVFANRLHGLSGASELPPEAVLH